MSLGDFKRSMPEAAADLRRAPGFWTRTHVDPWLLLLLLLAGYGLYVFFSAVGQSEAALERQLMRLGLSLGLMLVAAQVPPHFYYRVAPWLYVLGVLLLVAVLVTGIDAKGAQRWVDLPGLPRFQPSELLKLVMPMALAAWLADRPLPPDWRSLAWMLAFMALPLGLILVQPDLGTALLIGCSGFFVILLAGISWRLLGGVALMGAAALPLAWTLMKDYQRQRVLTFLDPERDPLGAGWNIIQSKIAIGSGGLEGKGWLQGTQAQLDFLPESHTDFIIAVMAEELGLEGVALLLMLYLAIIARGLWLAARAQDSFGRLLAGSIVLTFFIYVFVNIGMVSGILPIVGVPLPLVSYGGTSMVTLMLGFGVVMSLQGHRRMLSS